MARIGTNAENALRVHLPGIGGDVFTALRSASMDFVSGGAAPTVLVDSTGGTPATTFAAITAPAANATTSLTADMVAVKNALAQTVATINLLRAALVTAGIIA